jgi:hypothetical protein
MGSEQVHGRTEQMDGDGAWMRMRGEQMGWGHGAESRAGWDEVGRGKMRAREQPGCKGECGMRMWERVNGEDSGGAEREIARRVVRGVLKGPRSASLAGP